MLMKYYVTRCKEGGSHLTRIAVLEPRHISYCLLNFKHPHCLELLKCLLDEEIRDFQLSKCGGEAL